ncbi:MAG: hypothetical protein R3F17_05835 [Planctomycetota bacterium]
MLQRLPLLACLLALPLCHPALAQEPAPAPAPETGSDKDEAKKEPERLKEWPKVEDEAALKLEVKRLMKASTENMGIQSAEALGKMGAGIAPSLLGELSRTRDKDAMQRIEDVLDGVLGAPHTRLLGEHFLSKSPAERRYAMKIVAKNPDPGTREQAEKAFAEATKERTRWEAKDRYLAALCCAASGSKTGLDDLITAACENWGKTREDLSVSMLPLRDDTLTTDLIKRFDTGQRGDQVNGLRLLSIVGTQAAVPFVKPLLDSGDASIRVAAINACRGIVDHEPPLGNISAFDAIELAKKWKDRL